MHEFGHNIGLHHSGDEATTLDSSFVEYADISGYMGYTTGSVNAKKCFNAAKMVELGWYASNIVSINPELNEEFDGKVIGVNDYEVAASDYTLAVEIANPDDITNTLYLTYNKAEGINVNTGSGPNEIRLVKGNPGMKSLLVASFAPGAAHTVPAFYNGRDLIITTSVEASVGVVDYIPLTIALEAVSCNTVTDCGTLPTCVTATCTAGACEYLTVSDCCGNDICEAGESCGACSDDCNQQDTPAVCNEIDGRPDTEIFGAYSNSTFGIKFNVDVTADISFYEIEADLTIGSGQTQVKVYTKVGAYGNAGESLDNWALVFNGISSSVPSYPYIGSMPFDTPQFSESGSTRAFYIAYEFNGQFFFYPIESGGAVVTNADASVQIGRIMSELTDTTMPNNFSNEIQFLGGIKYDYPRALSDVSTNPSAVPSDVPSLSMSPSAAPSDLPSVSLSPSSAPSDVPSVTANPSAAPSDIPSLSMSPSAAPSD